MTSRRTSLLRAGATAALAAVALAGCGEVKNTINPRPGTANHVTVVLQGPANALDAGIYEAQALGYFRQTDMDVRVITPKPGQDPVTMVHDNQVLVAISSEPDVLLHRNVNEPVVGVAAIVHVPLSSIVVRLPKRGPSGGAPVTTTTTTATRQTTTRTRTSRARTAARRTTTRTATTPAATTTTMRLSEPDATTWPARMGQLLGARGHPTYDGLEIVVRADSIVNDTGPLRRFVQAVARGYRAAHAHPGQAINKLIDAVPALAPQRQIQAAILRAAMPHLFPHGLRIWGWQRQAEWNAFGTWMTSHQLLSNPNAVSEASTNELLQAQGV